MPAISYNINMSVPGGDLLANNATNKSVEKSAGQSASAFAASLVVAIVVFTVEAGIFVLIKDRFSRI